MSKHDTSPFETHRSAVLLRVGKRFYADDF
jgi:hypothetical protein